MITFEEILERAENLGLPIAWNEFTISKSNPAPELPYLIYLYDETQRGADNKNMLREIKASFELYTDRKPDRSLESRIENEVLFDTEFNKEQVKIDSENMVQTAYDFTIIQKISRKEQ